MKKFKVNEKEWQMPESFDEMSLEAFLRITNLQENQSEAIFKELYIIKLIEALVGAEPGDLDDLTLEELGNLTKDLDYLNVQPNSKQVNQFVIDGVDYSFPESFNKLTTGEYISIFTLTEGKSTSDTILYLLSVILRPAKKVYCEITKKEKWVQNKFDAENIEYRKNLFKKLPVLDVLWSVNFFLTSGIPTSENSIPDSLKKLQKANA